MKVKRTMEMEVESFKLGDVIEFTLTTGDKVEAKAVQETPEGMIFIHTRVLKKEEPMFKSLKGVEILDYEHSDLRKKLNGEILDSFPEEIKARMKPMKINGSETSDLLRIPTEKEIYGDNQLSDDEPEETKKFDGIGIAAIGKWWWLQNIDLRFNMTFVRVGGNGYAGSGGASSTHGVRPVFIL